MTYANWSYPTTIKFGNGRVIELAESCHEHGITRALLVTDKGLKNSSLTAKVLDLMKSGGLEGGMFAEIDGNPTDENLQAGLSFYKSGGYDGVIALGGGSGMDIAKLIAFMQAQKLEVWAFEEGGDAKTDAWKQATREGIAPVIAIPTTAGTGSEVGRASVLSRSSVGSNGGKSIWEKKTSRKKVIFHPDMLAKVAICDPELTCGLPKALTAGTGMDAFAHCLEAYCSPNYHPMGDGIALEGLRLVSENLLGSYNDGNNLYHRGAMMSAALMGAVAFQKGLGAIHAMSHPLGAKYNLHHGTVNAVVMRGVLKFNRSAIEKKIDRASAYLGLNGGFDSFYELVDGLCNDLSIPKGLKALGVEEKDIEMLSELSLKDPTAPSNPITLTKENLIALYYSCM